MKIGDRIKLTSNLHTWTTNCGYKANDTGVVVHADNDDNCWVRMDKFGKRYFFAEKEIETI